MGVIHHSTPVLAYTIMRGRGVFMFYQVYGMLGGYVEPSTRAHSMFQHQISILPACSVKVVVLFVLGSILPPYSSNVDLAQTQHT
jgi:hypothetical protein